MKTLKQIQAETKIEYAPKKQRKLPMYLTQIERHQTGRMDIKEVLGVIACLIIVGIAIMLAVVLGS